MAVLVAAVVLLGGLVLVNLLLTTAIIRKLRTLGKESSLGGEVPELGLAVGAEVPPFSAVTVADAKVGSADFAGERTLVGFFSTDCRHCLPKAPAFVAAARDAAADGVRTLAVVVVHGEDPANLLAALADEVSVVVESEGGAISTAFAIAGFPSFFLVGPDTTVDARGHEPERLPAAPSRA
ncbi:redoxin domain-containing protein [Microbispora sp. ZYX-F-249]|uniref:Redoxin domain-containing protein n=1 Tax=Microbispora maris TaxID=3144104 RepID=A0ABV0AXQ6_9ACTN